jgi:hypothetical protein
VTLEELIKKVQALEDELRALREAVHSEALHEIINGLQDRDRKKNKSSAVTREMTEDDAVAVLTGPAHTLNHKEAAAALGLTYAQVYSCRLGYTFKYVHKRLKDESNFRNPWERK